MNMKQACEIVYAGLQNDTTNPKASTAEKEENDQALPHGGAEKTPNAKRD